MAGYRCLAPMGPFVDEESDMNNMGMYNVDIGDVDVGNVDMGCRRHPTTVTCRFIGWIPMDG